MANEEGRSPSARPEARRREAGVERAYTGAGDRRCRYSVGGGKFAAEAGPKRLHINGAPLCISHMTEV